MSSKPRETAAAKLGLAQFMNVDPERAQEMVNLQKELLEAYEQASHAWLARVKSEVELWSELAKKLSESRSAPEVLEAYQHAVAQRMKMAAEDGQRMSEEARKIMEKISAQSWVGGPAAAR